MSIPGKCTEKARHKILGLSLRKLHRARMYSITRGSTPVFPVPRSSKDECTKGISRCISVKLRLGIQNLSDAFHFSLSCGGNKAGEGGLCVAELSYVQFHTFSFQSPHRAFTALFVSFFSPAPCIHVSLPHSSCLLRASPPHIKQT